MNCEYEDAVELGVVSADTRGAIGTYEDYELGRQLVPGLGDD